MSENTIPVYRGRQIDPNILSVLDIISEGKVVSVENWTALWNLVLEHINTNTAFCISIDSLVQQWHTSEEALTAVVENFNKKYDALSKSFIHYGENPPENKHTRIWVQPVEDLNEDDSSLPGSKDVVRFTEQNLFEFQKERARDNIGAADKETVDTIKAFIDDGCVERPDSSSEADRVYGVKKNSTETTFHFIRTEPYASGIPYYRSDKTLLVGTPTDPSRKTAAVNVEYLDEVVDNISSKYTNALKGSASGTVVSLNDTSPVEHNVSVKLYNPVIMFTQLRKRWQDKWAQCIRLVDDTGNNVLKALPAETYKISYHIKAVSAPEKFCVGIYFINNNNITTNGTNPTKYNEHTSSKLKKNYVKGTLTATCPELDGDIRIMLGMFNYSTTDDNVPVEICIDSIDVTVGDYSYTIDFTESGYLNGNNISKNVVLSYEPSSNTILKRYGENLEAEPTEYTPNADGTVEGVTSLYPNMTLITDTQGTIITVEYNRDINKAFAALEQAILNI